MSGPRLVCRCDGILHALDADARRRARAALERAQSEGKHDLADHYQSRLNQCPTAVVARDGQEESR